MATWRNVDGFLASHQLRIVCAWNPGMNQSKSTGVSEQLQSARELVRAIARALSTPIGQGEGPGYRLGAGAWTQTVPSPASETLIFPANFALPIREAQSAANQLPNLNHTFVVARKGAIRMQAT